jgi:peptidoglycan/LPS O-acetylase OafA/YrhL
MKPKVVTGKRIEFLESIRGLAAIIVVLHHFGNMFLPAISNGTDAPSHTPFDLVFYNTPLSIFFNGNFAVCIFFVVGGFTLSYKYFQSNIKQNLFSAVIKRYLRLALPVLGSMVFVYILMRYKLIYSLDIMPVTKAYWMINDWKFTDNFPDMIWKGLYNTFFLGDNKYLPILWTMKTEFISSIVIFAVLPYLNKLSYRIITYAVFLYFFWDSYYLAFLLGIFLAEYYTIFKQKIEKNSSPLITTINLLLLGIGIYIASMPDIVYKYSQNFALVHIISAFLIIFSILNINFIKEFLSKNVFQFLGKISFSMYLTHLLILISLSAYLFDIFVTSNDYIQSLVLTFSISFPIIILVAYIYSITIDKYSVTIATLVSKKMFKN